MIVGMKELDIKLKGLSLTLSHRMVGSAIFKAAKPMEDTAKSLINVKTGNLRNSIGRVRTPLRKANTIGEVKVGPRVGGKYKGYHGHLVEFGTKNRPPGGWYARFPNAHTTSSKPHPFMVPAERMTGAKVIGDVGRNLYQIIQRYIKTGTLAEV